MQKIRVLYVIDQLRNKGGAEKSLLNILGHINQNYFTYFLYTFQLGSPMTCILDQKNIKCIQIPYPLTIQGLLKFPAIVKEIRSKNINILHSYFEGSDIWGTFLAKLAGIPVIISSRRDMGFSKNKKILTAYRCINPFVTKIISVSDAVKRQVNIQEKVNLDNIVTIYNGVDLDKFNHSNHNDTLKFQLRLNITAPIIGVLANIRPIKGIEFFIHAASQVQKQFPQAQFIVIGACLPNQECIIYYDDLKSLVKELELENSLFFLGERSDIPDILSIMDVSVLPSLSEGFSNTIIESMSAGKPLVVTDVGGNSEAVVHGKTGIVVPPKNINKLADAILCLLRDKTLAERMGEEGRKRVRQFFSIETMIDKIENLYITALNHKNNSLLQ